MIKSFRTAALLGTSIGFGALSVLAHAAADNCRAASSERVPTIVELYTSEGCSSCPPADKWLSSLKGRSDVLPLAFHVDYWDRLGWVDRFATPAASARQYELAHRSGSNSVYTPQVRVNGRDWTQWPRLPKAEMQSAIHASLARDGQTVTLQVAASASGPARLDGYWAVLEDDHQSKVRAGENAGATLKHDGVVRLYQPVAAWSATAGNTATLTVGHGVPQNPRRVVFVVTDATTHQPLQAVSLAC